MVGKGWLCDGEPLEQFTGTHLSLGKQQDDPQAVLIAKGLTDLYILGDVHDVLSY